MGGQIKVIIREENGKIHKHERWTNPMPYFVKTSKFLEKNKAHIKNYIQNCNKEKTCSNLSPVDYGIVVFDFKSNIILSCQSYTGFNFIRNGLVEAYINEDWDLFIQCEGYTDEELKNFKNLFENKKIISYNLLKNDNSNEKIFFDSTDKIFLKYLIDKDKRDEICVCGFNLDLSPFALFKFSENAEGLKEFKNKMIELNFVFSTEDNKEWDNYVKEINERISEL